MGFKREADVAKEKAFSGGNNGNDTDDGGLEGLWGKRQVLWEVRGIKRNDRDDNSNTGNSSSGDQVKGLDVPSFGARCLGLNSTS